MIALAKSPAQIDPDQRIFLHVVSWENFERILAMRGDSAGVRVTYLKGELELRSPSRSHEWIKTAIARTLEAWAQRRGMLFEGYGSWTLKSQPDERGAEPDECYIVSDVKNDAPDLAIEVIWTSGGIDKLEVYRGLNVREVWMWRDDAISIHVLRGDRYEKRTQSECLPDIDVSVLAKCVVDAQTQTEAVRLFLERSS